MTEDALGRARALVKALRQEGAGRSVLGPFFQAAKALSEWLGLPEAERAEPRELVASFAAWAMVATEEARADRDDARREDVRRARWRCAFLVAEAFDLDPFGRTAEEAEEQERERGGNLLASYDGPRCAGVRKDGRPCRGMPRRGSRFCYLHQEQAPEPAPEPAAEPVTAGQGLDSAEPAAIEAKAMEQGQELDPEAAFDAEVDRWLREAARAGGDDGDATR